MPFRYEIVTSDLPFPGNNSGVPDVRPKVRTYEDEGAKMEAARALGELANLARDEVMDR